MRHLVCVLLLLSGQAFAQAPAPLYAASFDESTDRWTPLEAGVALPTVQSEMSQSGAALRHDYSTPTPALAGSIARLYPGDLTGARSIDFWCRTSAEAILGLAVQEQGGGRYISMFYSPANRWQHVEMSVDRLRLADDTNDDNNTLDWDQVVAVALIDVSVALPFRGPVAGDRSLFVDEFRILTTEAPTAYATGEQLPYVLDDFQADYTTWLPLLGSLEVDSTAGELVWTYGPPEATPALGAIVLMTGNLPAADSGHLVLTFRSARATQFIVSLQEENRQPEGERGFNAVVQAVGGPEPQTVALSLADFRLEDKLVGVQDGPLRLDRVNRLTILDLSLLAGQVQADNTVHLQEVLLTP